MAISELVRETVVGILYGIFLWTARVSTVSTSKRSQRPPQYGDEKDYGLSIALRPDADKGRHDQKGGNILKSCKVQGIKSSPSFFTWLPWELSSLWTTSTTGDFLGTESGVHMTSAEDGEIWENQNPSTCRQSNRAKEDKICWDMPPPLTLLQGQGETTGPLPWFLKRECINGRLILKEVSVEHSEYLRDTRAETNLVAQDNAYCCHTKEEDGDEIFEAEAAQQLISSETWNGISWESDEKEENPLLVSDDIRLVSSLPETTIMETQMKMVDKLRKCMTYTEGLASCRMAQLRH